MRKLENLALIVLQVSHPLREVGQICSAACEGGRAACRHRRRCERAHLYLYLYLRVGAAAAHLRVWRRGAAARPSAPPRRCRAAAAARWTRRPRPTREYEAASPLPSPLGARAAAAAA
eukprot:1851509-Prymnesium_polylepis.1